MRKVLILLAAAVTLGACSEPPGQLPEQPSGQKQPEPLQDSVSRIVQPEMIGASLHYLESLTGPPVKLSPDGELRTYKMGACTVEATVGGGEDKSVSALRMLLAPGCDVDVGKFLHEEPGSRSLHLSQMSFGSFQESAGRTLFYADCLSGCGNASDPSVYAHWEGTRALDFLEVMLEVRLVGDAAIAAADQWQSAMVSAESEDWIMESGFNCDPGKYGEVARKAFAAVQPEAITIGRGLAVPRCAMPQAQGESAGGTGRVPVPQPASECDYGYDETLKKSGLVAKETPVHGPDDEDFGGYGCPYRISPTPGTTVPKGSVVQYRTAWEGS